MAVLLAQTEGAPENLTAAIRNEVRNIAPDVPIFVIRTTADHYLEYRLLEQRIKAEVLTSAGVVGLVLGVLGLYGVIRIFRGTADS